MGSMMAIMEKNQTQPFSRKIKKKLKKKLQIFQAFDRVCEVFFDVQDFHRNVVYNLLIPDNGR